MVKRYSAASIAVLLLACPLVARADVTSFTLMNADSDQPIAAHDPIVDGADIDLDQLPSQNITIRANVDGTPASVSFDLTGQQSHSQTENVAPFALFGDSSGNYDGWDPSPPATGDYGLSARTHTGSDAGGTASSDLSIGFTITAAGDPPPPSGNGDGSVSVSGTLQRWHRVTVEQQAVAASETSSPNPFLDYRFNVTFTSPDDREFVVPGYFAGNGNGGGSGTAWHAHLSPDTTGEWSYEISFRSGNDVAVSLNDTAGSPVSPYDGASGTFTISESSRTPPDFRAPAHGLIKNRGGHYLTYAGGGIFLKGGPDIPENMFGYDGFDNTPNAGHSFNAHESDWNAGDPDWNGGAGRGLIGAFNYLNERGVNSVYFLPMNIGGDGKDTFPTIGEFDKTRYDLSKLGQWEIAMTHAQSKGIFLHLVLAETESGNENYHDNGELGPQRKLFYRMLVARFGHHNGLQFNIGEENDYGTTRREQFAAWIKAIDPYDHPVTTHTKSGQYDNFYDPLLGNGDFDMTSFQGGTSRASMFNLIQRWREDSAATGTPWVISFDEPQKIENNLSNSDGYPHGRRDKMWPAYMGGAGGFEWYVQQDGGGHSLDQQIDDFGIMAEALNWTGHALDFLGMLPLRQMQSSDTRASSSSGGNTFTLEIPGNVYAIYNDRNGGPFSIDLGNAPANVTFTVTWFNPRTGQLLGGEVGSVTGGSTVDLGSAPSQTGDDWAVLLVGDNDFIFSSSFEPSGSTAPSFSPAPDDRTDREGDSVSLQIDASDPDNSAPLAFSATGLPPGLAIDPATGLISGTIAASGSGTAFAESDNLLVIEMESADSLPSNWPVESSAFSGSTGSGYIRYDGSNHFNNPGIDTLTYPIRISNPGTYRFQWRSIVGAGTNGTEHNDSWLKIDADAFFAERSGNVLCPKGFDSAQNDCTGGSPNGSGSDGWFKVYRSGGPTDEWKWSTRTSDNDAHEIFARFDSAGTYSISVAGRSAEHVIDRMVMYRDPVSTSAATSTGNPESDRTGGTGASADSPYSVTIFVSDESSTASTTFTWTIDP